VTVSRGRRGTSRRPRRFPVGGTDSGSVTLLSIAFGALALLLMTAVVSATGVHLEQKRLLSLADELALDAADAVDLAAFYRGEAPQPTEDGVVPLTDGDVRRAVEEYFAAHPMVASDLEGLRVVDAGSDDGRTARVTLAALARPPLVSWVTAAWSDGIPLTATASARAW
jgi:hypothetical protein